MNEKGYSLLLVLVVFLVFSIIGLTVFSATISGAKQTKKKEENVQATYLAEKGINYFQAEFIELIHDLNEYSNDSVQYEVELTKFKEETNKLLKKYEKGVPYESTQGHTFTVKIIEPTELFHLQEKNKTMEKKIYIESTGIVKKEKVTVKKVFRLQGRTTDALKYALSAYNNCQETSCNNKGNVTIFGAPSIKGNMYVGGNLASINYTHYYDLKKDEQGRTTPKTKWTITDFPTVENVEKNKRATTHVGGQLFTIDPSFLKSGQLLDSKSDFFQKSRKESAFSKENGYIPQQEIAKLFKNDETFRYIPMLKKEEKEFITADIKGQEILQFNGPAVERLNGTKIKTSQTVPEAGRVYEGDVTISNNTPITIQGGPIYIKGNLIIKNANVSFDSVIYVEGFTEINDSKISANDPKHSLILFSRERISIANTNSYKDVPISGTPPEDVIQAFLYSDDLISLQGIISNIQIYGGLFGSKVILNGSRGNTKQVTKEYESIIEKNQTKILPERARLRIVYNEELLRNRLVGLPMVNGLDLIELERKSE